MKSILRRLNHWLDCLAFANAGNIGDFHRLLHRRAPAASVRPAGGAALTSGRRLTAGPDPTFARWLARWNGAPAARRGRIDENA